MLKFISHTEIEFEDGESLEVFIRTLPIPLEKQLDLINGQTVEDKDDRVEATGSGNVIHQFSVEGEEE
jgi:hypothetical protein